MIIESKCQIDMPLTQEDVGGSATKSHSLRRDLSLDGIQRWKDDRRSRDLPLLFFVKYHVETFLMLASMIDILDKTLISTEPFYELNYYAVQNETHKELIIIIFMYQMYRLYSKIFRKEEGNYKMIDVIN